MKTHLKALIAICALTLLAPLSVLAALIGPLAVTIHDRRAEDDRVDW